MACVLNQHLCRTHAMDSGQDLGDVCPTCRVGPSVYNRLRSRLRRSLCRPVVLVQMCNTFAAVALSNLATDHMEEATASHTPRLPPCGPKTTTATHPGGCAPPAVDGTRGWWLGGAAIVLHGLQSLLFKNS